MDEYNNDFFDRNQNHLPVRRKKKPKRKVWKSVLSIGFSAMLFGAVSSGTFYGVTHVLTYAAPSAGTETMGSSEETSVQNLLFSSSDQDLTWTAYDGASHVSLDLDVTDIAALGMPSVVSVTNISVQEVENFFGRFGRNSRMPQVEETVNCGSGIILKEDDTQLYIVTNYHVVEGATTLSVTFADDQTYEAQLCGYDAENDIAVMTVFKADLTSDTLSQITPVTIGDSDELVVGEQVVAIGNALGYGQSVTTGIVSAVNRTISSTSSSATYIQTDAAINPGNSGGALLNMEGELIGINTAKIASSEVEGMGYAIPISRVMDVIEGLMG